MKNGVYFLYAKNMKEEQMRRFVVEIDLKNAAFEIDEGGEVATILTNIAGTIRNHGAVFDMPILDLNGNHCGDAIVEDTEPLT